ncbi:MAG: hypothetical protein MJ147_09040 [Clostridia bacterium]|nr:hypothetical protein [Clostridia bacterium]
MKIINTNGIGFIELLAEKSSWYCGTDYSAGDLYEAEEIFNEKGSVKPNRLVFIHHPDGQLFEPIMLKENQYFGRPTELDGIIYILLVDFEDGKIKILACKDSFESITDLAVLPLSDVEDCYNLLLRGTPLMLTRQGRDNSFQVLWQEKLSFKIGETEAFLYKKGDKFYFSRWLEDPDYREEVVIRNKNGEVLEVIKGSIFISPTGEEWVLK